MNQLPNPLQLLANPVQVVGALLDLQTRVVDGVLGILPPAHPLRRFVTSLRLLRTVDGYKDSMAIGAAVELGVFEALGSGSRPLADVAVLVDAPEGNTEVLLEVLCRVGLVRRRGDRYEAERIAAGLVDDDAWHPLRTHTDMLLASWGAWRELPEAVRAGDGHPEVRVYNEDNPLTGHYVRWACASLASPSRGFVEAVDVTRARRVIAGTAGATFVKAVTEVNPDVTVTISCLPHLVRELPSVLEHYGMKPPAEVVVNTGDADTDTWGAEESFDLVFLARKFAYFPPEHGISYLRKARDVIPEGGMVVVWEPVRENWASIRNMPERLALTDVMMGAGRPLYRKADIARFVGEAGYDVEVVDVLGGTHTFVVGHR